jgi:ArsR family transcriptional regulator
MGETGKPECQTLHIHTETIDEVKSHFPDKAVLQNLARFFRIFGDPTRIRILQSLFLRDLCVCDLSGILGISVSAVSHQLSLLRSERLVTYRKEGKLVIYSLADDHVRRVFDQGMEHVLE